MRVRPCALDAGAAPRGELDAGVTVLQTADMVAASELLAQATAELADDPRALRSMLAIVGAFVADAAATPTHWVYDQAKLEQEVNTHGRSVAFFQPSLNPFYTRPVGASTCYGEQLLITLRSLVEHGGQVDNRDIGRTIAETMGINTEYGPLDTTIFGTRELPIDGPWRHGSVMHYIQELANGSDYEEAGGSDDQAEAYVKSLPVIVSRAGSEDFLETVEETIRTLQDNDPAVVYGLAAARVLEEVLLGGSAAQAASTLPAVLKAPGRANPQPDDRYVANRLDDVLKMAETGSYLESVSTYGRSYDIKTYLRHDGVEMPTGATAYLN